MQSIRENLETEIASKVERLKDGYANLYRAERVFGKEWMDKELECRLLNVSIYSWSGTISLMLWNPDAKDNTWAPRMKTELNHELGIMWEDKIHICNPTDLEWIGEGTKYIDDKEYKIKVTLTNVPKPENCLIKKITTTEEVVRYEAECLEPNDGEEYVE